MGELPAQSTRDLEPRPNYVTLRVSATVDGPPVAHVPRHASFDFSWDYDGGGQAAYDLADAAAAFLRKHLPDRTRLGVQWIRHEYAEIETHNG